MDKKRSLNKRVGNEADIQRLEIAVRSAGIGTYEWDIEKNAFTWDNQASKIFEQKDTTQEKNLNRFFKLLHPDDLEYVTKTVANAIDQKKTSPTSECNYRIVTPNGRLKYIKSNTFHVRNKNNEVTKIIGTILDVSESLNAKQNLNNSRNNFSILYNSIEDSMGMAEFRKDGFYLVSANKKMLEGLHKVKVNLQEFFERELVSYCVNVLKIGREKANEINEAYYRAVNENKVIHIENKINLESVDEPIFTETTLTPVVKKGETPKVIWLTRVVTEKKIVESRLTESENKFKSIVEFSPIAMACFDASGELIIGNKKWIEFLGVESEEKILGVSIYDCPSLPEKMKSKIKNGKAVSGLVAFDFEFVRENTDIPSIRRDTAYADISLMPLKKNGTLSGIILQAIDVTAQFLNQKKLTESQSRLESIFNNTTDMMCLFQKRDGYKLVSMNQPMIKFILDHNDSSLSDLLNLTIDEFWSKISGENSETTNLIVEGAHKAILDNKSLDKEILFQNRTRSFLEFSFVPIRKKLEEEKLLIIGRDITAKREQEKSSEEIKGRVEHIISHSFDWQILATVDSTDLPVIEYINDPFCNMLKQNYSQIDISSIPGKEVDKLFKHFKSTDGDFSRQFNSKYRFALQSNEIQSFDSHVTTALGRRMLFQVKIIPIVSKGKVEQVLVSIKNDSNSAIHEQELNELVTELDELKKKLKSAEFLSKESEESAMIFNDLIYASTEFEDVVSLSSHVAPLDATVLIQGETGTGKEVIARAIHDNSERTDHSFIKLNCGALPKSLIEAELFGHVKGAFTGASQARKGRFEVADNGTLFLDEIGELPLESQSKLLRVIQEGEFERLGSSDPIKTDVRIIAATNKDLKVMVANGTFREDLYYRLNVFPIRIPPLRKRVEDIPALIDHFVKKYNSKFNKNIRTIDDSTLKLMLEYSWPGNVRELENVVERAIILSASEVLEVREFSASTVDTNSRKEEFRTNLTLDEVQRSHILRVLQSCNWKIAGEHGAAKALNLAPSTLRDKIKKYKIQKK